MTDMIRMVCQILKGWYVLYDKDGMSDMISKVCLI